MIRRLAYEIIFFGAVILVGIELYTLTAWVREYLR